ncbi:MAG: S8 family serine peptidase [Bacteroidales bacterium]|nr:S8 family serine peptidase [Bacteroidales bacterium]
MKTLTTLVSTLLLSCITMAQLAPDKYWVRFTDKNNSPYSIENPQAFLSQKAIDRRITQGILVVENDLPVNPSYISAVVNTGATLLNISKWYNSVTVYTNDPAVLIAINALPFVLSTNKISNSQAVSGKKSKKPFFENESMTEIPEGNLIKGNSSGQSYDYGQAFNQINMLNGIALHDLGYDGADMTIAVLDAGFLNTNILSAFDSLWINNQILGYKDFVDPLNPNIFGSHSHGTNVLSTMGANLPNQMVGTAPKANYWLLRSEDAPTEYLVEELNWVSAAEFADSAGVDVINSSLGYTTFDDPSQDHTYQDMDGNTTPITNGGDLAASKGILVVNSAGNSGNSSWQYIGAPADGDSVFSIGAVDASGNYASFSSTGPTYDGRIKPNVVAQGLGSSIISASSGDVISGSGTSFSSPITAGMVTCLWQAHPDKRITEIMDAIQQSASLANTPNMLMGYGIPDYYLAHTLLSAPVIHEITLDIKVFLEGPFNGTDMDAGLNSILTLAQPYNTAPWNYNGTENVTSIPNADVVDWVLIELRDTTNASQATGETMTMQQAAFLLSDGSIVDLNGSTDALPIVSTTISNNLYIVIYHRNHLAVMSANALIESGGIYTYNFSTGATQAYGAVSAHKEISTGIWGMIGGDLDADGTITVNDKNTWTNQSGTYGYQNSDANFEGQINNQDKNDVLIDNDGKSSQVPQ